MLFRIFWKNKDGITGNGDPIDEVSARAWVRKLTEEHPDMKHWIVPVKDNEC
jgi:hypothetical protein